MTEVFDGLGFAPFGVITAICFIVGLVVNSSTQKESVKKSIPSIMILVGAGLGIAMFFTSEQFRLTAGEFWWALAIGGVSGVAATGIHQVWKQNKKEDSTDVTIENTDTITEEVVDVESENSDDKVEE